MPRPQKPTLTAARAYAQGDRIVASYGGRIVVSIEPILGGHKYYRLRFDIGDTVLVAADQRLQRDALLADLYDTSNHLHTHGTTLTYEDGIISINGVLVKNCVAVANGLIELQLTGGECVRITDGTYNELISA